MEFFLRTVLLFSLNLGFQKAHAVLMSEVIGVVGTTVVTSREVKINHMLDQILFTSGQSDLSLGARSSELSSKNSEGKSASSATNDRIKVLLEWAVFYEAKSFKAADPSEVELKTAIKTVQQGIANSAPSFAANWNELEVSSREIDAMVDRKVRARKFIDFKSKASRVPVTDVEALQYFQKNRMRFGSRPFNDFRETVKAYLSQVQADERLKDWFRVIQKKYSLRLIEPQEVRP